MQARDTSNLDGRALSFDNLIKVTRQTAHSASTVQEMKHTKGPCVTARYGIVCIVKQNRKVQKWRRWHRRVIRSAVIGDFIERHQTKRQERTRHDTAADNVNGINYREKPLTYPGKTLLHEGKRRQKTPAAQEPGAESTQAHGHTSTNTPLN